MGIWKKNIDIYKELEEVDQYIEKALVSKQAILNDAIGELLKAGGKRLRPALVLLSGKFGKYRKEKLMPLAAGIEILHMATLVHDDIIDEAKLRRGMPTVQARWGKDVAVFAGDFLFARAFSLISEKTSFENMHYLSRAIQAICEGEVEQFESRYSEAMSLKKYLKRIGRKTALLFALSCQVGAQESDCKPKIMWHLRKFGMYLGMAFQLTDDLLDFSGEGQKVGKPVGNDFAQGVYTLPVIYTFKSSGYQKDILQLMNKDSYSEEDLLLVKDLVFKSGGIEYTRSLAKRYIDRARVHLEALPENPARQVLEELLVELIERKY